MAAARPGPAAGSAGRVERRQAVVVGGGPAGLAAAAQLRLCRIDTVVLDAGPVAGASWAGHYDSLRLNTVAWTSHLPGLRFSRGDGPYPTRDQVVDYLARYVRHHRLEVRWATRVQTIEQLTRATADISERARNGWLVHTDRGTVEATTLVLATGSCARPRLPDWPGRTKYTGPVLHSSRYRNPEPFRDLKVLVVGAGNSGGEIAADLAAGGASSVHLSVRTPPQIVPRRVWGIPTVLAAIGTRRLPAVAGDTVVRRLRRAVLADLPDHGLRPPIEDLSSQYARGGVVPLSHPGFFAEVRRGRVGIVAAVERLSGAGVHLSDGSLLDPDVVIAATGYTTGLEALVGGLGILDSAGRPLPRSGRTLPEAPGLHAIGFTDPLSGNLREIRLDARRIARAVAGLSVLNNDLRIPYLL
jgi:cation diffusion facilitator CzcD-associated flavoprotein CzcO